MTNSRRNRRIVVVEENETEAFCCDETNLLTKKEAVTLIKKLTSFYEHNSDVVIDNYIKENEARYDEEYERLSRTDNNEWTNYCSVLDSSKCRLTDLEMENIFANTELFDAGKANYADIKYPVVIILYLKGTIVHVGSTRLNLFSYLGNYKQLEFDEYSIIETADERAIETYLKVKFSLAKSYHIDYRNGWVVTLNQLKKRYKEEKHINKFVLKKIITIYNVKTVLAADGTVLMYKNEMMNAIQLYLKGLGI